MKPRLASKLRQIGPEELESRLKEFHAKETESERSMGRQLREYWSQVAESEGTNFELSALLKYNMTMHCLSSYYLTLVACDLHSGTRRTFQVQVVETRRGGLNLTCSIARPLGATPRKPQKCLPRGAGEELPVWPSDDALNDRNLFYVVEESELQNTYWIRLYLELAVDAVDMSLTPSDLSKLEIVKVAIQTKEDVEPPNGRLNAKNAIVYISFKGLAIRGTGEHVERKVIVRRVIDERNRDCTQILSKKIKGWYLILLVNRSVCVFKGEKSSLLLSPCKVAKVVYLTKKLVFFPSSQGLDNLGLFRVRDDIVLHMNIENGFDEECVYRLGFHFFFLFGNSMKTKKEQVE